MSDAPIIQSEPKETEDLVRAREDGRREARRALERHRTRAAALQSDAFEALMKADGSVSVGAAKAPIGE